MSTTNPDASPTFRVEVVSKWNGKWKPLKEDFKSVNDAEWIASYYRLVKEQDARVLKLENKP